MREISSRWLVLLALVLSLAACETKPGMEPYFLVTPDSVVPAITSALSRWDSRSELEEWTANPWVQAPYTLGFENGVEFAHADLRAGVNSTLYGPNLEPSFKGLQSVRVRARYFPLGSTMAIRPLDRLTPSEYAEHRQQPTSETPVFQRAPI